MLAFTAKTLLTPTETVQHALMLVADAKIVEIATLAARPLPAGVQVVDLTDGLLAPGYVDLHIHGGGGFDVMDGDIDALYNRTTDRSARGHWLFPDHRDGSHGCDLGSAGTSG